MLKQLIILTLTVWCLTGITVTVYGQEGDPEEFGKKNVQTENESEEVSQHPSEMHENESEEPGNLTPQKVKAQSELRPNSLNGPKIKKSNQTQVAPKPKESKSKYNILFYYFYKSKHEQTDSKEGTANSTS